ncbi:hypothetical protein BsWGS_14439 [Bradybaena similaris]
MVLFCATFTGNLQAPTRKYFIELLAYHFVGKLTQASQTNLGTVERYWELQVVGVILPTSAIKWQSEYNSTGASPPDSPSDNQPLTVLVPAHLTHQVTISL